MMNTNLEVVFALAKARREVMSAPLAASALVARNWRRSKRVMGASRSSTASAAQELWSGEQQRERLCAACRARDRLARVVAECCAEQLGCEVRGVLSRACTLADGVGPFDALHQRGGAIPVGATIGPARG